MSYDNSPLLVERNERGFWTRAEQIDTRKSVLGMGYVVAQSGVAVPLTGTVADTSLDGITLPGGLMGANGMLRVTSLWTCTNNANNKFARLRVGGWAFQSYTATALGQLRLSAVIWNRGSESAQVCGGGNQAFMDGVTVAGVGAGAIDTSNDQVLTFAGQLANAADTLTLEAWVVEVFPT